MGDAHSADLIRNTTNLLQIPNATVAWSVRFSSGLVLEHNASLPVEAGSTFKAIVAAECCRQVENGLHSWHDPLVIRPEDRVPSSTATDPLPDGTTIPLDEAVRVMLTCSDNTATDLVTGKIGHESVVRFARSLGLRNLTLPPSVKYLYAHENDPDFTGFISSMRDLRGFYDAIFHENRFKDPATYGQLLEYLHGEDADQGVTWPNEVICYRKSGSLDTTSLLAQAIAGAFTKEDNTATWAFAVNVRPLPHEDQQETVMREMSRGLGTALKQIAGML